MKRVFGKVWMLAVTLAVCVCLGLGSAGLVLAQDFSVGSSSSASGEMDEGTGESATFVGNYGYNGTSQTVTLPAGKYKLETWGASGGGGSPSTQGLGSNGNTADTASYTYLDPDTNTNVAKTRQNWAATIGNTLWNTVGSRGGAGGYSTGVINLATATTIYIYVGGAGTYYGGPNGAGGFNGGGGTKGTTSGSGGGATDIRIGGTGLYNRVIVAGGGGGSDNGPCTRTGGDDGSGGAGGGATAEGYFINGLPAGAWATDRSGASFGDGASPTTVTDTGGGGGGWYGGTASNHNNGGAGGGSGYVLTASSYRPANYAPAAAYNMSNAFMLGGIWSGHGKARITLLNDPPVQNTVPTFSTFPRSTVAAGANTVFLKSGAGANTLNITDTDSTTVSIAAAGIFTTTNTNSPATEFLNYNAPAGNTAFTVSPKKWWSGNKPFYMYIKDSDLNEKWVSFNMSCPLTAMVKGAGASGYKYGTSIATTPEAAIANGTIYHPSGAGKLTVFAPKPISLSAGLTINATELFTDAETVFDKVLITGKSVTDHSYFKVTSSATLYGKGNESVTISSKGVAAGANYFVVTLTVSSVEMSTTTALENLTVDVVFKIDNTRPTFVEDSDSTVKKAGPLATVAVGETATINIADFCKDPDTGNTNTILGWKFADKEFYSVNKYGETRAPAASVTSHYNIGAVTEKDTSATSPYATGMSQVATGFEPSSIVATSGNISQAYASVEYTTTQIKIKGLHASRSQYSPTRAKPGLGHFYFLVQIKDNGEDTDTGIYYPIAVQVTDSATDKLGTMPTFEDKTLADVRSDNTKVFSPMGIGAINSDWTQISAAAFQMEGLATDKDNFTVKPASLADSDPKHLWIQNEFLFLAPTANNIKLVSDINEGNFMFKDFFKVTLVPLYASADVVDKFLPEEQNRLKGALNNTLAKAYDTLTISTGGGTKNLIKFYGIKIETLRSTQDKFIQFDVDLMSSRANSTKTFSVQVKGNNVSTTHRLGAEFNRIEGINDAPLGSDRNDTIVEYKIYNGQTFWITPYDIMKDADSFAGINTVVGGRRVYNSNPKYSTAIPEYTELVKNVDKTFPLKAATEKGGAVSNVNMSLGKLSFENAPAFTNSYGTVSYKAPVNNVNFASIQVMANARTLASQPITFTVDILDSELERTPIRINVHVLNSAPYLRDEAKSIFYLMASNGQNSSDFDTVGTITTPPSFSNGPTSGAYNVREFLPIELLNDKDNSDLTNSFVDIVTTSVRVGTKNDNGDFVAFSAADGEKYVSISFGAGTGRRSIYSRVMRIEGKNSTQGLKNGFFIQFTASDTYDTSVHTIQFEVMNSAPGLNKSAFAEVDVVEGGGTGKAWVWDFDGINEQENKTTKYLASDADVLANAKDATGISIPISAKAGKVLVTDSDVQQKVMLSPSSAKMLPTAYMTGSAVYDRNKVAVWYANPYNDGTTPREDSVLIRFYDRTNGYRLVTSPDANNIDNYAWMIHITPDSANMPNGLDINFAIRSTNHAGAAGSATDTVGGDTRGDLANYQGSRSAGKVSVSDNATGDSRTTYSVKLRLNSKGLTNNHEFYLTDDAHSGEHFAYKLDNDGAIMDTQYSGDKDQTIYYTDLMDGININGKAIDRAIPANNRPVYVPISYFAMQTAYQKTQSDKRVRFATSFVTSSADIFNSITITDGEKVWTGENLNTNPYLTFGTTVTENFDARDFIDPAKRLVWSTTDNAYTTTSAFEEDNMGISIAKKNDSTNGGVRTDKPLTLTVKLASYSGGIIEPKTVMDVSLKVATRNSQMSVNSDDTNRTATNISTYVGDKPFVVPLISEATDKAPYTTNLSVNNSFIWYSDPDRFQGTETNESGDNVTVVKKDFGYYMANSVTGEFTADQITILKNALKNQLFANGNSSKYFGSITDATLDNTFRANPNYSEFFTVEPNADSRSITIRPKRKTELNWIKTDGTKMSAAEYTTLAESFGLKYDSAKNETYYPFKVIVYDDYNGTGVAKASFDVVEFRIRIKNDTIKINPAASDGGTATNDATFKVSLKQGASTTINVVDIIRDGDLNKDGLHYSTKSEIEAWQTTDFATTPPMTALQLSLLKATTDFLPTNSVKKQYEVVTQEQNVDLIWDAEYYNITIKAKKRDMSNAVAAKIKVTFFDNISTVDSARITFIVEVSNSIPTIEDTVSNNYGTISMRSGDYFTLVATTFKEFKYGAKDSSTVVNSDSLAKFNSERGSKSENVSYGAKAWTYDDSFDTVYLEGKKLITSIPTGTPNNYDMGYLALAHDDTPWALRIADVKIGDQGTGKILPVSLNRISPDGTNDLQVATAYRFEAIGACDNVPVTVILRDEKKESTTSFTFKVSIISTPPQYIVNDSSPDINKKLGGFNANKKPDNSYNTSADRPLNYDSDFNVSLNMYIYKTTLAVGQKRTFKLQDFAFDIDTNDSGNMYLNREYFGNPFKITSDNSTITSGAMSTNYFEFTDTGKEFTITCKNFHNAGQTAPNYDILYFRIMDPSAKSIADGIEVQLRIYTTVAGLNSVAAAAQERSVKSRAEYLYDKEESEIYGDPTVVRLVGKDKAAGGLFTDVDYGAKNVRYTVSLYYLNNMDQIKFLTLSTVDRDALKIGDFGKDVDNKFKPAADSEFTRLFYKYFESIEFSEDGSIISLVPKIATTPLAAGKMPIVFEVTKFVDRDDVAPSAKYASANFSIKNSTPMAVGNTQKNYDNKLSDLAGTPTAVRDKNYFLTCVGTKGTTFEYWVYDSTPTAEHVKNEQILFYDLDTMGEEFDNKNKVTFTRGSLKVKKIFTEYYDSENVLQESEVAPSNALYTEAQQNAVELTSGITAGNREWIKLRVLKKLEDARYPSRPLNVVYTVAGTDASGAMVTTEIKVIFVNSPPQFAKPTAPDTKPYTMTQLGDGSYLMKMLLEKDKPGVTLNLADIVLDDDFDPTGKNNTESFKFVNDGTDPSKNLAQISGDSSKIMKIDDAFTARVVTGNNLKIYFEATSFERGKTSTIYLTVEDSAGARTSMLTIELTVANTKATVKEAMYNEFFSGGTDADITAKEFNILDFIDDVNAEDIKSADSGSTTYHTITSIEMGPYDGGGILNPGDSKELFECIALGDGQKFYIKPLPNKFQQQVVTINVRDDGGMGAEGAIICSIKITVHVSKNASKLIPKDVNIYYCHTDELKLDSIFYDDKGVAEASSYYISDVGSPDNSNISVIRGEGDKKGKFFIKGNTQESVAKIKIYIKVIGDENSKATEHTVTVNVQKNYNPNFHNGYASDQEFDYPKAKMTTGDNIKEILILDMFQDPELDPMTFVSVTSQKTVVVEASINKQENKLVLLFKGRGTSKITVEITDATGVPFTYSYIAQNLDLPELNFFVNAVGHMQENPLLYIVIACAVVLFLIILIAIIAAVRKKRRMREEIEALLVSEMELEEQMLKLAASPSPTFYQSYGYLPPTQNVQNSNFMLGEGHNMQSNNAIGLNPGGSEKQPNSDFGEDDL